MPKLVLLEGNCDRREFHITDKCALGRGLNNDIKILDHNVSRNHAIIELHNQHFLIRDLSSTNGTLVNGLFINEKLLTEGDQIQIGKSTFLFEKDNTTIFASQDKEQVVNFDESGHGKSIRIAMELETQQLSLIDEGILLKNPLEVIKAYRKLSIIFEVGRALCAHTQLVPTMSQILESLFKVLPADRGIFLMADPYTQKLAPLIMKRRGSQASPVESITLSQEIISYVQEQRKGILTSHPSSEVSDTNHDLKPANVVVCVPLILRDQVIGMLWLDSMDRNAAFTPDDLELMTAVAQQTSLVIENIHYSQERIRGERFSAIGEMVSSIAHEIKNPLSSIQIYTDLLSKLHNEPQQTEFCTVINQEIERLLTITNQILDYSQTLRLNMVETDADQLCRDVCTLLRPQADRKNISIDHQPAQSSCSPRLDPDKMKQVLFNIILNAIQVCPDGSTISVSCGDHIHHRSFRFRIADNGPGIPPNSAKHIFQPFFSGRKGGTGLGLAICQRIVEEHHGRILLDDASPHGAVFIIEIPQHTQPAYLPHW